MKTVQTVQKPPFNEWIAYINKQIKQIKYEKPSNH